MKTVVIFIAICVAASGAEFKAPFQVTRSKMKLMGFKFK
jgi:hypothetical protein